MYPTVYLKPGKEDSVRYRHPWVYSGAIERVEGGIGHGVMVRLVSAQGEFLGVGSYSVHSSISVRVFSFTDTEINAIWLKATLAQALEYRKLVGVDFSDTAGWRWVFGEADQLPGLVIDVYGRVVVIQISTMGMDRLRWEIVEAIKELIDPVAIVERSEMHARDQEGIDNVSGTLWGQLPDKIAISENGVGYLVDVVHGQKTGFFLDQRDLRRCIGQFVKGKEILNLFSYTGSLGLAAMKFGAKQIVHVDSSKPALNLAKENYRLNNCNVSNSDFVEADVFDWCKQQTVDSKYDVVCIDPPALIKSRKDYETGKKAYRFLAGEGIRLLKKGGVLVFSSCSRYLTQQDLWFVLRQASIREKKELTVLKRVGQASDHKLSLYFPESEYLKTLVLQVN